MKKLHFRDNFKNFLYDLDNFITIYDNHLHIFNYDKLDKLSDTEIILKLRNKTISVSGNNLKIKQMTKEELYVVGIILRIELTYD